LFMDVYNVRQNNYIVYEYLQCKNKYWYCLWIFTMQEQILILFMNIYNAKKILITFMNIYNARTNINIFH
jgi:hypothetical protein